jgi:hypothetical protein
MQPYFFPYPGYFSLIKHVALFFLLDTVQTGTTNWTERNRILKPGEGWQYIRVPLMTHSRKTRIMELQINNETPWKRRLMAQLEHYKKRAPFYDDVTLLLHRLLAPDFATIVDLNHAALRAVCDYLGIGTPIRVSSRMELELPPALAPDDWSLNICRAVPGVDEYWNPPGGKSFYSPDKYAAGGVKLRFHRIIPVEYDQRRETFAPDLSILDAMMFNSPGAINEMLDHYELS